MAGDKTPAPEPMPEFQESADPTMKGKAGWGMAKVIGGVAAAMTLGPLAIPAALAYRDLNKDKEVSVDEPSFMQLCQRAWHNDEAVQNILRSEDALHSFHISEDGLRAHFTYPEEPHWRNQSGGVDPKIRDERLPEGFRTDAYAEALEAAEIAAHTAEKEMGNYFDAICMAARADSLRGDKPSYQILAEMKGVEKAFTDHLDREYGRDNNEGTMVTQFREALEKKLIEQNDGNPLDEKAQQFLDSQVNAYKQKKLAEKEQNKQAMSNMEQTFANLESANRIRLQLLRNLPSGKRQKIEKQMRSTAGKDGDWLGQLTPDELKRINLETAFEAQDIHGVSFSVENGQGSLKFGPHATKADRAKAMQTMGHYQAAHWFEMPANTDEQKKARQDSLIKNFYRNEGVKDVEQAERDIHDDMRAYLWQLVEDGVPKDELPAEMPISITGPKGEKIEKMLPVHGPNGILGERPDEGGLKKAGRFGARQLEGFGKWLDGEGWENPTIDEMTKRDIDARAGQAEGRREAGDQRFRGKTAEARQASNHGANVHEFKEQIQKQRQKVEAQAKLSTAAPDGEKREEQTHGAGTSRTNKA